MSTRSKNMMPISVPKARLRLSTDLDMMPINRSTYTTEPSRTQKFKEKLFSRKSSTPSPSSFSSSRNFSQPRDSTHQKQQRSSPITKHFWNTRKKPFIIATIASFMALQILFLGNMSYLFGAMFKSENRINKIHILVVDYDGGVIGKSLTTAMKQLSSPTFPAFNISSSASYPTSDDLLKSVRQGHYWAALYTHPNASARLATALEGGEPAQHYNPSNTISYIYDQVHYPAMSDSTIKSSMQQLLAITRITYNHLNGTGALATLNQNDPLALQVLLNPMQIYEENIQPTTQGTRVLYNTVAMVMPIIAQFFFLLALNNIGTDFNIFSQLPLWQNAIVRAALGVVYTFLGALLWTAYIWAFKEDWSEGSGQFGASWMAVWLYMHINFLVVDVGTAWLPMKLLPFLVLTWVILNVTSTLWPLPLMPSFYLWSQALPAHQTYTILVQIWSHGALNNLYRALPILFTYEIVFLPLSLLSMKHRCTTAVKDLERSEEWRRQMGDKNVGGGQRNSHGPAVPRKPQANAEENRKSVVTMEEKIGHGSRELSAGEAGQGEERFAPEEKTLSSERLDLGAASTPHTSLERGGRAQGVRGGQAAHGDNGERWSDATAVEEGGNIRQSVFGNRR